MNAAPLHQAAKVEGARIACGTRTMQPQPLHPDDVAGQIRQAVGMHVDADDPAGRLPRLPPALQPLQAQIHELTVAARFHGPVNDALDVPAFGARRQPVRHVLGRQRQALPAEMQAGQKQSEEGRAAAPPHGSAGPAGQQGQPHCCQHADDQRRGKTNRRVDGTAAQQARRQAQQRPLPQAGRVAFQALQGAGQRATAQHGAFMVTGSRTRGYLDASRRALYDSPLSITR